MKNLLLLLVTMLLLAGTTFAGAGAITAADLATFPWLATPKIGQALAQNSAMPGPHLVFFVIQATELINGAGSQDEGLITDPTVKGVEWFKISDDRASGYSELVLYYDPDTKWISTGDMEDNPTLVPVTETVKFYSDHWEQVNANGTFTGKVEMAH